MCKEMPPVEKNTLLEDLGSSFAATVGAKTSPLLGLTTAQVWNNRVQVQQNI
jgi:hypothetical protein